MNEQADARRYMSVQLQLLDACNLRCAHCYNIEAARRQPSTAEVKRRLDAIYAFGERHGFAVDVHLSGGEPTLRKDLVELVDHIFAFHDGDALLFTNGTRWTRELARELRRAGLWYVQVSLEGPEALTDEVRGDGVYRQALEALHILAEEGFRRTVSITVTARNFPVLFDFVAELDALDVHFHLREVMPLGAGEQLIGLDRGQRRRLSEWAVDWHGKSTVGVEDPIHCSVAPDYARTRGGCVAGRNHFCVEVDGSVQPCRPLEVPVGHVDDLEAMWSGPVMRRLRARDYGGRCGRCEIVQHCGGCRVFARAEGDLYGEDSRCFAPEHDLVRTELEARAIRAATWVGRQIWQARTAASRLARRRPAGSKPTAGDG